MDLSSITPQQKMLAAAGANVLFIVSLWFPWFGVSALGFSASASGWDVLPSSWLALLMAAAAAALLASVATDRPLPVRVPPLATAMYLTSVPFWFTVATFLEGGSGRKWGLFASLLFSLVAAVAAFLAWREEEA